MAVEKTCTECCTRFLITDDDLKFYDLVSPTFGDSKFLIPTPSHCPRCRQKRRLTYRNERTLHRRICDFTQAPMVSIYSPECGYTVYNFTTWHTDDWDPMKYGRDFDFSKSFFEQFDELHRSVPLISLFHQASSENCEFTNLTSSNKNSYLIFAANDNEDCYYSTYLQRNKSVVDSFFIFDSELCYECLDVHKCYNLKFSQNCSGCSDSQFLYDCRSCTDCFGCVSLVNKRFHIFNKQYSESEYRRKLIKIISSEETLFKAEEQFLKLRLSIPAKYYSGYNNENCTGDYIRNSKNTLHSFDCTHLENCKYCTWLHQGKHCQDCYAWGLTAELGYENHLCGNNFYQVLFSESCGGNVSNLTYCRYCMNNSKDLFGCIGLKHKQFCILNKQYTEKEYYSLVAKIINHMKERGEWGEFFPSKFSPFAYNESVANEYFPMTREEVLRSGLRWNDSLPFASGGKTIEHSQIPWNSSELSNSLSSEVLECICCSRNYKILTPELTFYKHLQIPVPQKCFQCRYQERFNKRNPRNLWTRECSGCGVSVQSSFAPEFSDSMLAVQQVYCESCYETAVLA